VKVLFIGGTGIISSACTQHALDKKMDLYLLNRGQSHRSVPAGAKVLPADIRDENSVKRALGNLTFDAVVDWIAFTPEHIKTDIKLFKGITKQFIFISSASAYHTPPLNLPVLESTALYNPVWDYSQNKIACEELLVEAYRKEGFPFTIVRPSHTYDVTLLPMHGGWTTVNRMRQGKKVVVHGDGTSLWTLTHHKDFAVGLVGLLGNVHALGEAFHITSNEYLTWNQIFEIVADAAGTKADMVHIPSDLIMKFDKDWGDGLLGDKSHSMIFDNSKIKSVVPEFNCVIPFAQGAREIIAWYDADPARQKIDADVDKMTDRIINAFEGIKI
jgi:nucleoside-diphosphate-sugar epimerase